MDRPQEANHRFRVSMPETNLARARVASISPPERLRIWVLSFKSMASQTNEADAYSKRIVNLAHRCGIHHAEAFHEPLAVNGTDLI